MQIYEPGMKLTLHVSALLKDQVCRFYWKQKNVCEALLVAYYLTGNCPLIVTGLDVDNDVIRLRHVRMGQTFAKLWLARLSETRKTQAEMYV